MEFNFQSIAMDYKIEETSYHERLADLGLSPSNQLVFFPENLDDAQNLSDFIFTDNLKDISKIFKLNDLAIEPLGGKAKSLRSRKNADWYAPAIFFSISAIADNPTVVSISLNVLSNYISDFFKGTFGEKKVHLDIFVEDKKNKKIKKIAYNGNAKGLKDLPEIIKSL